MSKKDNQEFCAVTTINSAGELIPNAGKFSRGAIIAAFEMIGGMETFAEWAIENKTDFYTKLLGKTVGRESDNSSSEDVEDLIAILDGEATDITNEDAYEPPASVPAIENHHQPALKTKMAYIGKKYSDNEPLFNGEEAVYA